MKSHKQSRTQLRQHHNRRRLQSPGGNLSQGHRRWKIDAQEGGSLLTPHDSEVWTVRRLVLRQLPENVKEGLHL